MKKAVIKRAAALLLAAVFAFAVSACASFADMVIGFADAAAYMHGESNVRSEITVSVKFSENAKPMTFAQLLAECIAAGGEGDGAPPESLLLNLDIGLSAVTEIYEDTALVSLGWIGPDGPETLLTLVMIDQTLYISTEIVKYIGQIDMPAEAGAVLKLLAGCDYIKIDLSAIPGMLEMLAGLELEMEKTAGAQAAVRSASDKLAEVLRDYTPKILTEEYKDVLKREGGGYTLTLNAETALALLGEIISLAAEYEEDIKAFLLEAGGGFGLEAPMLDELDFGALARDYQKEMENAVIGKDIPNFDLIYKVAGTGDGDGKKQTSSVSFVMQADGKDVPFDTVILECGAVTTVMTKPVAAPAGKVLSLEELIMKIMLGSADMSMFGF